MANTPNIEALIEEGTVRAIRRIKSTYFWAGVTVGITFCTIVILIAREI